MRFKVSAVIPVCEAHCSDRRSRRAHARCAIYLATGQTEKALDELESLLKVPYHLTPGWLQIDPNFDPLRSHPRFRKLVADR